MEWVLVLGSVFNMAGWVLILASLTISLPYGFPKPPLPAEINPPDYMLYRLFTAGTAFTFGAKYYYLFRNPCYAATFLPFGMCLKYWAFASSLIAYRRYRLPGEVFAAFGCTNGCVAVLFSIYLLAA